MTILQILTIPHKVLNTPCLPVNLDKENLKQIITDMFETMHSANGIGLAGNQVNINKRILVIKIDKKTLENKLENKIDPNKPSPKLSKQPHTKQEFPDHLEYGEFLMINPSIVKKSKQLSQSLEGCLSIPEILENITRHEAITVEYHDLNKKLNTLKCKKLLSYCVQHEIDHLNGKLFIDYLSLLKKSRIKKKFFKQKYLPPK